MSNALQVLAPAAAAPPVILSERKKDVRNLAAGAGIALAGRALGRFARLAVDIVLAHLLGPASFGLYAIGWTVTRVLTLVSPLGLDAGVIRFGSQSWRRNPARFKGVVRQCLKFSTASGLTLGALLFVLAPRLGADVFHQPGLTVVFRWFALGLPLLTALTVTSAATRISQRMKFSAFAEEISQPVLSLLLIFAVSLVGWSLKGALGAITVSMAFSLFVALWSIHHLFPEVVSGKVNPDFVGGELFTFSLPTALSSICGIILPWVDRLIVGYYRSPAEAGIYYAASQLSIALAVVLSAFGAIIAPMIASLYHQGQKHRLEELYRVSTKWSLYLSIPPFLVMCLLPKDVMTGLFGRPYAAGAAVLGILGMGQVINAGTGAVGSLLVMTGNQNRIAILSGLALLGNLGSAIFLTPRWGIWGAALGTAGAVAALSIAAVLTVRHSLGIWPYDRRYLKGLLAGGASAGALILLHPLAPLRASVTMASGVAVALVVFIATLLLCGMDAEDREFIRLIQERVRSAAGL